jgi:hypothetical protein
MSDHEDADGDPPIDDGSHEPTNRFAEAVTNVVSYHIREYDLTAATVVGVLAIEMIRRTLHAMRFEIPSESEDEE